jgi:hypothetical protein
VELKSEKPENLSKKIKSFKTSTFEELEKILYEWFKQAHVAKIPINGLILKEKARLGMQNFTASNGWIDLLKKRHKWS